MEDNFEMPKLIKEKEILHRNIKYIQKQKNK